MFNRAAEMADAEKAKEGAEATDEEEPSSGTSKAVKIAAVVIANLVVVVFFICATVHVLKIQEGQCDEEAEGDNHPLCGMKYCTGYGLLLIILVFAYVLIFYYCVLKPNFGETVYISCWEPFSERSTEFNSQRVVAIIQLILLFIIVGVLLFLITKNNPRKLVSLIAPTVFIFLGFVFSTDRSSIKWKTVITGITLQFFIGLICIRWSVGRAVFRCIGEKFVMFLFYADPGSRFVFGQFLVENVVFAFAILPIIFFFSFSVSILYYLGTMQLVIMKIGGMIQVVMGTTVCESVNAVANTFLSMSESPLLIRPFIIKLTKSELHAIMVAGFATVAGSVLAAYVSFGAPPAHLITSTVMACPGSLAFSKLYMPETEESTTSSDNIELEKSQDSSILDAACNGANNALPIVLGICANIVAFIACITFFNAVVEWTFFLIGFENINFEFIFSKAFIPLVWAMGVPYEDCNTVASIVSTKTIINEFVAFQRMGQHFEEGSLTEVSKIITTYAICGFANPGSMGILIGSLSAMAPERRPDITACAIRAFVVGSIVCFVSASFAGVLAT